MNDRTLPRWISGLALLVVLIAGCATYATVSTLTPHQHADAATYLIDSPTGTGSGVMIYDGQMLTAAHLFENGTDGWTAETDDGRSVPLRVEYLDRDRDLALVRVDLPCPCAQFAGGAGTMFEEVFAMTHPLGYARGILTTGHWHGSLNDEGDWIGQGFELVIAQVSPGSSGGGVWVTRGGVPYLRGLVHSINVHSWPATPGFNIHLPVRYLATISGPDNVQPFLVCATAAKLGQPAPGFDCKEVP